MSLSWSEALVGLVDALVAFGVVGCVLAGRLRPPWKVIEMVSPTFTVVSKSWAIEMVLPLSNAE